jgi:hypothetical protein
MKTLNLNFGHPVKGIVRLFNKLTPGMHRILKIDTKADNCANIILDGLQLGRWKASIDWEYDNRTYHLEQEFDVA